MVALRFLLILFFVLAQGNIALASDEQSLYLRTRQIAVLQGHGDNAMFQPSDVVVSGQEVFVVDGVHNRIVVFDKKGHFLRTFGRKGPKGDQLKQPLGIAADKAGYIYVADSQNHRIQIFSRQGRWLRSISLAPYKTASFPADPTDLVVDEGNHRLVIVDNNNHRLLVYSLNGKFMKSWGEVGLGRGQLRYPYGIDMDKNGNFYVCEVLNTRVQVFDPQGGYGPIIGEWGVEKGQLYRPQAVALDRKGRVFVADAFMGVVQIFDQSGKLIGIMADSKGKRYNFNFPTGLTFDADNHLYLVEMRTHKVRVFKLLF